MAAPQYHSKLCSADVAVQAIKSHNRVFMTGNCSVPKELLGALVRRAPDLEDVEIVQVLTIGPADYVAPEMQGHIRVNSLFISHNVRKAVNEGRADFTPIFLSQIPQALRDPKLLRPDVAMIHCSPPDEHGFCTFGVEVGLTKPAAESARIVIAEVNDRMPRTLGDSFIHVSRLTHIVPVSYPIVEVPQGAPGELQKRIAEHIAELIPDGATMQMGIGEIPDAVLLYLKDKRDLGVHTELFSDGVMELIEAGVLNNAAKTLHRGKCVAGFALGSQRLYDYVDNNPMFEFHPQDYVNDPVRHRAERQAGVHQLGAGGGSDGAGVRRLDRPAVLQRRGRPARLHLRRVALARRRADHRAARDGQGWRHQPHRADAETGRGRGHVAQPRPLHRHRARRGRSARQDDPPAGAGARQHRRAGVSGRS